jgi:hypothetical protein
MATANDLHEVAEAFLDAAIDALDTSPPGAPTRAFISTDEPALDCCETLAVFTRTLAMATAKTRNSELEKAQAIRRGGQPELTLYVQISRCVPTFRLSGGRLLPPTPAALTASAQLLNQDGWKLWLGLTQALKHGALAQLCSGAERLEANQVKPQGGCAGWLFSYRYPIEGGKLAA